MAHGGPDRGRELRSVGGRDHREVGDAAHDREILGGVMRGAVEAEHDAGVMPDQSHGQRRVREVGADLLACQ